MNTNQNGFVGILITIIALVLIGIAGYIFIPKILRPAPQSYTTTPTSQPKYDVNQDGKIDQFDTELMRKSLNCKKEDPCWNNVIGKTQTGDNPIYTYDVDFDQNGIVDQADIDIVQQNMK